MNPLPTDPVSLPAVAKTGAQIADEMLLRWRHSPYLYVTEALLTGRAKKVTPTDQQIQALEAIGKITRAKIKKFEIDTAGAAVRAGKATPEERMTALVKLTPEEKRLAKLRGITIKAGKGVGKDGIAAWLISWFTTTMPRPKNLVTAPTFSQLIDVLWSEVAKWYHGTDEKGGYVVPAHDAFTLGADKFFLKALEGKEHFTVARTARTGNASQAGAIRGYHEDYTLNVIDEASDTPDPVADSIIGSMTGPVNISVVICNPMYAHGFAWRTHEHSEEKLDWWPFTFNAEDSPLVSREQIAKYARSGRESNIYRINVRGEFPLSESDVLIPYEFVRTAALKATHPEEASTTMPGTDPYIILGIDPAGEGADSTVVCVRHDNTVVRFHENSRLEAPVLLEWLASIIAEEKPNEIAIDATGLGWTLAGMLRTIFPRIVSVLFQAKASDPSRFANKRTEIYWRMREAFVDEQSIVIPNDEFYIQEFATGKYGLEGRNIIALKPKKDIKRILGYSPDHADATALTFHFTTQYLALTKAARDSYDFEPVRAKRPHWTLR